jgi:hypothetical protein
MKRKKQYGHLKSAVVQAFQEGKSGAELVEFFEIPKSTIYDWLAEFRKSQKQEKDKPTTPKKVSEKSSKLVPVEVLPQSLTVIDGGKALEDLSDLSDFQLARQVLRGMAQNPDTRDASRIQASLALARLVQLEAELPKHVLEGKEQSSIASERKKLEGLSAEELAREYQRELERLR